MVLHEMIDRIWDLHQELVIGEAREPPAKHRPRAYYCDMEHSGNALLMLAGS